MKNWPYGIMFILLFSGLYIFYGTVCGWDKAAIAFVIGISLGVIFWILIRAILIKLMDRPRRK